MASELNVEAKHSVEKQAAWNVDCFTTVSDITGMECAELLDKPSDVILMNGFENDFVPCPAAKFNDVRKQAREKLLKVANTLMGSQLEDDTVIVTTSGRYEYQNKGINVYIDALNRLRWDARLEKDVLAFVMVPAWMKEAREDLKQAMQNKESDGMPIGDPRITHALHDEENDKVLGQMNWLDIHNRKEDRVKIIFVPCYLDGNDGIFNMHYYDLLIGNDLTVFPSYYEPWGYTPMESAAFHVPCVTTDLAGFGLWANNLKGGMSEIEDGVKTIHRSDYNFDEVSDAIRDTILKFTQFDKKQVNAARKNAAKVSEKALWKHFIAYYYEAYDKALAKRDERMNNKKI
jgi:glycosyltransferase involved in cell wall biosynthesis